MVGWGGVTRGSGNHLVASLLMCLHPWAGLPEKLGSAGTGTTLRGLWVTWASSQDRASGSFDFLMAAQGNKSQCPSRTSRKLYSLILEVTWCHFSWLEVICLPRFKKKGHRLHL